MWLAGLGTDVSSVRTGWKRVTRWITDKLHVPHVKELFAVSEDQLVIYGASDAALMFGAVAPTVEKSDVLELASAMLNLWEKKPSDVAPPELVKDSPTSADLRRAWDQGYGLARAFLDGVRHEAVEGRWVNVEKLIENLGIQIREIHLQDQKIRGVSVVGRSSRPGIFINMRSDFNKKWEGRRFTIAHELCHILHDRQSGHRLAIASGPWAPRDVERRANAFAAMLLMPEDLVALAVAETADVESLEGVNQVASVLRTGFLATLPHLRNLGYLDDETVRALHEQAVAPTTAVGCADGT